MKRIGYIFEKISSVENLNAALDKACQHKRNKYFVRRILDNREYYIQKLHNELVTETYKLNPNIQKVIYERSSQKQRALTIPKFYPDQVIQWAVCLQLEPIIMRGMDRYCCGSIPGRGGHYGKKYIDRIIEHDTKTKYVLKLDIRKFFQSVNNDKLKELLRRKIKDPKALRLIDAIIDNGGDGLPIGYYTSQWFSNFYLEKLDHYIKEELRIRHYIRYVDDMVLLDTNKRKLHRAKDQIAAYLAENGYQVTIKDNWQLWKIHTRPLDFLGYRFYKHKTVLRKRIFYAMSHKVRLVKKRGYCTVKCARALISSLGWLKHIPGGKHYYLNNIKPVISKRELTKIISTYDKKSRANLKAKALDK